ncbi:MAG: dienelactone hydrolase family protein [Pseudomonadales bacterium]
MKKILIAVAVLAAIAGFLLLKPVQVQIISAFLPGLPDWPAPNTALSAEDSGEVYYQTASPYDLEVVLRDMTLARPTVGLGYLSYPDSVTMEEPIPAMVILSGSGGITPGREHEYAAWFVERGIAAFVVDYYQPRGFQKDDHYLFRNASVTEFDVISDAYAALALLGSSPLIDANRIGVIGFSYGGMAARLAMDSRIHSALAKGAAPFSLHIDVYGPCFQNLQSTASTGAPLLTLRGTEDSSNELPACVKREDELRALGSKVSSIIYEGAGHAWEAERPRSLSESSPYLSGCELKYDEQGVALLNGEQLGDVNYTASLAEKVLNRFTSGGKFQSCLGYGYLVGRDEKVREQAYRDVNAFVGQVWAMSTEQP